MRMKPCFSRRRARGRFWPRVCRAAAAAAGARAFTISTQLDEPGRGVALYAKEFPSTSKATWGGHAALKSPNNVLVLFTKVDQPPATQPQTASGTSAGTCTNERATMARLRADGVTLLPLYTGDRGAHGQHQQRHLSRHRRRPRPDRRAARRGEEEQRQAGRRRRLRLHPRPRTMR
jgi:hypothetical protein